MKTDIGMTHATTITSILFSMREKVVRKGTGMQRRLIMLQFSSQLYNENTNMERTMG
jgi:hypothetical protein